MALASSESDVVCHLLCRSSRIAGKSASDALLHWCVGQGLALRHEGKLGIARSHVHRRGPKELYVMLERRLFEFLKSGTDSSLAFG